MTYLVNLKRETAKGQRRAKNTSPLPNRHFSLVFLSFPLCIPPSFHCPQVSTRKVRAHLLRLCITVGTKGLSPQVSAQGQCLLLGYTQEYILCQTTAGPHSLVLCPRWHRLLVTSCRTSRSESGWPKSPFTQTF